MPQFEMLVRKRDSAQEWTGTRSCTRGHATWRSCGPPMGQFCAVVTKACGSARLAEVWRLRLIGGCYFGGFMYGELSSEVDEGKWDSNIKPFTLE